MKILDSNPLSQSSPSAKLIRLYPSYYALWGCISVHLVAMLGVLFAGLALWTKALLVLALLASLRYFFRQWQRQAVFRVQYIQGYWRLIVESEQLEEQNFQYKIVSWHFFSVYLMILSLECEQGKRRRLTIVCDSCSADEFRWLRVVVKFLVARDQVL